MNKRKTKYIALIPTLLLGLPIFVNTNAAKADECPKLIIVVACDSKAKRRCCPTFTAEAAGNLGPNIEGLRFNWAISSGKIVKGQGTPVMRFETKGSKEKPIEVRLKVEGLDNWPLVCPKELLVRIDYCKEKEKSART
jgi:hypothetical protein